MRKIAILLIVAGLFLFISFDAMAGITYPRNQVGIFETQLNAHPWDDPFAASTGVRASTIARPADREISANVKTPQKPIYFSGPLFFRLISIYWKVIISDYGTNSRSIVIIKN